MASPVEINTATTAALGDPDASLQDLLRFAEGGIAFPVTLVVGGVLVTGMLATDQEWGQELDRRTDHLIRHAEAEFRAKGESPPAKAIERITALREFSYEDDLKERRARIERRKDEVLNAAPEGEDWKPTELPDDLGLLWGGQRVGTRYLTVKHASVLVPPGRLHDVDAVRVAVDQIGAWWPATYDSPQNAAAESEPPA
jgi:hypothetical protein